MPQQEDAEEDEDGLIYYIGSLDNRPYEVQVEVNGKSLQMEIDTGAGVSLISQATQKRHLARDSACSVLLRP